MWLIPREPILPARSSSSFRLYSQMQIQEKRYNSTRKFHGTFPILAVGAIKIYWLVEYMSQALRIYIIFCTFRNPRHGRVKENVYVYARKTIVQPILANLSTFSLTAFVRDA